MAAEAGVTTWRLRGGRLLFFLLPVLLLALHGGGALGGLERGGRSSTLYVTVLVLLVAGASLGVLLAVRTRVRLLPDGVEVRELRTRTYPWSEIGVVSLERRYGRCSVRIALLDGTTRTLPAPSTGRPDTSDAVVLDAVAAIEDRLPAGRPRVPDTFTSLDDLLHE